MAQTIEPIEIRPRQFVMSVEAIAWAFHSQVGAIGPKLVLLKLADHAGDQGECWPKIETIARECEMSRRSVFNHLSYLEKQGFVERAQQFRDNRQLVTLYKLSLGRGAKSAPRGARACTEEGAKSAPRTISKEPSYKENKKRKPPMVKAAALLFGESIGLTATDIDEWWDYHAADGWMQTKTKPIVDAEASLRTWQRNKAKFARPTAATLQLNGKDYGQLVEMSMKRRDRLSLLARQYGDNAPGAVGKERKKLESEMQQLKQAMAIERKKLEE